MKWRYESVAFLLCCLVFRLANASPAPGKKDLLESSKLELLEKKINPSSSEAAESGVDESDDLLARAKKSSTTTTFCVEIKPGNDQPTVVVCDPSKNEHQVPIPKPSHPPPAPKPTPTPEPELPNWYNPPIYGDLIPDYPRELQPAFAYEPLIYVPQQPQIYPPFYQQPQVVLIRDPSCPSSNPSIVSSFLQPGISPGGLYASRSINYPAMGSASIWKSAYNPEEDLSRSVPGANVFSGMLPGGYQSQLNLVDPRRGDLQQNQFVRTLPQNPALSNVNQSPEGQLNRQFLVQCNPTLTPLPQNPYANTATGKANEQDSKSVNMGPSGATGHQSQFMYPAAGGQGYHGSHMTHEAIHHHNKGLPMHMQSGHHYQSSNMYPYSKPYNMHNRMTSNVDAQERAAEGSQVAVKGGQEMPMQQDIQSTTDSFAKIISGQQLGGLSQLPNSQSSSFNGQVNHQGVSGSGLGDGRVLMDQKQQKMGSEKLLGGGQASENQFYSSSFNQGQNDGRMQMANGKDQGVQKQMGFSHSQQQQQSSFVNGDRMQSSDSKDQGFQKQMGFSQNQNQNPNQQKMIPNGSPGPAGSQQKHSAVADDMPSYSQMLLQKMRSAVSQNNLVQPFMVRSSDLIGEKSTQSKV